MKRGLRGHYETVTFGISPEMDTDLVKKIFLRAFEYRNYPDGLTNKILESPVPHIRGEPGSMFAILPNLLPAS